jgi:hypothetical protein
MNRPSRKPSTLSESLQRHLNAYALAASAAGVGMSALAQPAEAKSRGVRMLTPSIAIPRGAIDRKRERD